MGGGLIRLSDITVEVRDRALHRLGQITSEHLHIAFTDVHNGVGEWSIRLPADHHLADDLRQPGSGIVVTGPDGHELYSGPTSASEYAATPDEPSGVIVYSGVTDSILLGDALAWPQPANPDPETQAVARDVRTGPAETVMHAFVRANIGPAAPSARRSTLAAHLTMGTDGGRGPQVTKGARFAVLGNVLGELAGPARLGFRIIQRGNALVFETFGIRDRTKLVRLDVDHNSLAGHRVTIATPELTRAIVGGDGQATGREFIAVTTPEATAAEAAWGRRIESFIDKRATKETEELRQAGLEALDDGGRTALAVQAVPMEDTNGTRPMRFGSDWRQGDDVAVVVEHQEVTATVTGYTIKADSDGFRAGVLLGDPTGYDMRAALGKRIKAIGTRVAALEQSAEPTDLAPLDTRLTETAAQLDARLAAVESSPGVTTFSQDARGPADPAGAFPLGVSILPTGSTAGWPAPSGQAVTTRTATTAEQRYSTPATGRTWLRHWNGTAWGPWDELIRASAMPRIAVGEGLVVLSTAVSTYYRGSLTITFPAGRFTVPPFLVASAMSSVPGVVLEVTVDQVTTTGAVIQMARTNQTDTGVRWIAIQ
ncbi:hypothetical protein Afil01_62210 [Actinorhabdospora filicis]|uniref:Gp28/Gp37-like domain-containing protein n=1 Tax=Actinorhabdospora filicis TaxID=1785913 RepID=A0A9W6ST01_9ACTN|nr:hypothetical protein [Actinorhabdospora filicis]GLZ81414.1 hypothetical protein Afil01_62210 [Actinorhabdospora filicis]